MRQRHRVATDKAPLLVPHALVVASATDLSLYGSPRSEPPRRGCLAGSKVARSVPVPRCRALAPPGLSGILGSFIIISTEVRSLISNWTSGSRREIREGRGSERSSRAYYVAKRVRRVSFSLPPGVLDKYTVRLASETATREFISRSNVAARRQPPRIS